MSEFKRQALATMIGAAIGLVPSMVTVFYQTHAQQHQMIIDRRIAALNDLRVQQQRLSSILRELYMLEAQAGLMIADARALQERANHGERVNDASLRRGIMSSEDLGQRALKVFAEGDDGNASYVLQVMVLKGLYGINVDVDWKKALGEGGDPPSIAKLTDIDKKIDGMSVSSLLARLNLINSQLEKYRVGLRSLSVSGASLLSAAADRLVE